MKNSRLIVWTLSIILTLCFASVTMAQNAAKIAVVDKRVVFEKFDLKIKADEEFKPTREAYKKKEQDYKDALEKYKKLNPTMMKKEAYEAETQTMMKKNKEFQALQDDVFGQLDARAKVISEKMDKLIDEVFKELIKKDGYTLILDSRSVVYSNPDMDITDQVVEKLNAKAKTMADDTPAAPEKEIKETKEPVKPKTKK
jgi:outer membrane protein